MTVFANMLEISAQAQGCKVIAAFPDVCFTPPQTPATPPGVPVPYPNFAMDSDLASGSGTVKIGGKPVSQENSSNFKRVSGDEAGCAPKKGVVTSKNMGKAFAKMWSMDVKVEGKGVVRFSDIATTNHASDVGDAPPMVIVGQPNPAVVNAPPPPQTECPCCGASPAHPHQIGQNGQMLPEVKEQDYYRNGATNARRPSENALQEANARAATARNNLARIPAANTGAIGRVNDQIARAEADAAAAQARIDEWNKKVADLEAARAKVPPCPNLHDPADKDCGVHYDRTGQPPVDRDALGFNETFRQDYRQRYDLANGTDLASRAYANDEDKRINHKTPLDAGGCPTDDGNLIPQAVLTDECKGVDALQSDLQGKR